MTVLREFDDLLKARQKDMDENDKYNMTVKLPYFIFVIADRSLADNNIIMRQLLSNNPYLGVVSILAYNDMTASPGIVEMKHKAIIDEMFGVTGGSGSAKLGYIAEVTDIRRDKDNK